MGDYSEILHLIALNILGGRGLLGDFLGILSNGVCAGSEHGQHHGKHQDDEEQFLCFLHENISLEILAILIVYTNGSLTVAACTE